MKRTITILLLLLCLTGIQAIAQPPAPGYTGATNICTGNGTTITATGQAGATFRWWSAATGGSLLGTNATYSFATQQAVTTLHAYVEQTVGGLTSTRTDVAIVVNQTPAITASTATPTVCSGNTATLQATGGTTYSWSPGGLTGTPVDVNPVATTTYIVTGTTNGCSSTGTVTVTISKTIAAGRGTRCPGVNSTLSATGANTYTWMPGNLSGSSVTVAPAVTTTYTVTGTVNGCITTDTVTIVTLPSVQPSAATITPVIAEGSLASLTCTSVLPATYVWTPNQNSAGTLSGNAVYQLPTQTTTYTVAATDGIGCTGTATVTVTVNKLPDVTGNTTICSGGTAVLTATGAAPFTWYTSASGGSPIFTGATFTTPTLFANTSYWVAADGGSRKEVKVNVISTSLTSAVAVPAVICRQETSGLQAPFPGIVRWYDASTGGNLVGTSTPGFPLTVAPPVTTTYYAAAIPAQLSANFSYTGNVQQWIVPAGVTSIHVDAYGARGTRGIFNTWPHYGKGGRVQAVMNVTPGDTLSIYVGGTALWNGGGNSGRGSIGGDATDIRLHGTGLINRILVAGGGGGSGAVLGGMANSNVGDGGGLTGQDGTAASGTNAQGRGGSQTAGGNGGCTTGGCAETGYFGIGGISSSMAGYNGGGGGGGWYGGGGGHTTGDGGGGSSYTNPLYCNNVIHTQGMWDDAGVVFITYGITCTGTGTRVPVTVTVKPAFIPRITDTLAGKCAGNAISLYASGLAPAKEVGGFDGTQVMGANGNGGHASITSVANNFTMEFWVKPGSTITQVTPATSGNSGTSGQRYAIMPYRSGANAGAGVSVGKNGVAVFEQGNSYLPALLMYNGTIPDSVFTHIAVTYTNKQPRLYINGYLMATGLTSTMPNVYPSIGSDGAGGYGPFIGQIDNVRIWNAPLTELELLGTMGHADTSLPGKMPIARYTFNNGSRTDDKGSPAQAQWSPLSSNPQQDYYRYTWSGTRAVPAASFNEQQTTTVAAGVTNYWVRTFQGGCTTQSDTLSVLADTLVVATVSGTANVCQDATMPVVAFTRTGGGVPYAFTYNINGGTNQTIVPALSFVRYIRIKQNTGNFLHLAEIRAIEAGSGENVALGKSGTVSNELGTNYLANTTDGNTATFWHSAGASNTEFIEIDLGAPYALDHVELVNRGDCCQDRAQNVQYILKDSSGTSIYNQQINVWQGRNTAYSSSWPVAPLRATVTAPTNVPGTYRYNLVSITTPNGCVSNQSGSALVSVAAMPTVAISTPATTICQDASVTMNAIAANGSTPAYQWYLNGSPAATGAAYSGNTFIDGDSISVKLTTGGACAGITPQAYLKLKVVSNPVVSISGGTCSGDTLLLNTGSVPYQLQWLSGSTIVQTNTASWKTAGTTVAGGTSGSGLNQLSNPNRSFVDATGNIYIAEANNHRVVKWAPGASAGIVVAGGNGQGTAANQLNTPMGVYADAGGNVYVADFSNARVQKWAPGATSGTTVAGITSTPGASADRLREPASVTMDALNNLYVTECYNHRVSKWGPGADTGITVAGNRSGIAGTGNAFLSYPFAARLDAVGNLYVADNANHRVMKWAPGATAGVLVAGTGTAGDGAGSLNVPVDVFIDLSNNLYIADQNNHRIQRWASGASSGTTIAGTGSAGSGPSGIMVDAAGSLYVTESGNDRVQKFVLQAMDTAYAATTAGSYTAIATTVNGCSRTTAAQTVKQSAEIISGLPVSTAVCLPNPLLLGVVASNVSSYIWRKGSTVIPAATMASYIKTGAVAGDAGQYSVIAMNANGCNDTSATSTVSIAAIGTDIPAASSSTSKVHIDGLAYNYTDAFCQPIAEIRDAGGGNVLGNMTVAMTIDGAVQTYRGQPYLQRHYDLMPSGNGPATVIIYATQAEFTAFNTYITNNSLPWPRLPADSADNLGRANISITQFHGLPSDNTTGPGGRYDATRSELIPNSAITTTWNGRYWTLSFAVSGFSGFFITSGSAAPLPIRLKDIAAKNRGNRNEVQWVTAAETAGSYFEVERSFDARNFTKIGTVSSRSINGAAYSFDDEQPANGINYYRLKMIEANGRSVYSKIVNARVHQDGVFAAAVYPNPAGEQATFHINDMVADNAMLTLMDLNGKILQQIAVKANITKLELNGLAGGLYLIRYRDDVHTCNIKLQKE